MDVIVLLLVLIWGGQGHDGKGELLSAAPGQTQPLPQPNDEGTYPVGG